MRIPTGVIVVVALCLIVSALLTYLRRNGYSSRGGFARLWSIFEDLVSQTLLLVMLVAATIQVTVRFLLSDYIVVSWTEELALIALVWLAFWSAAAVSRRRDHVALTLVYDMLPAGPQRALLIFGDIVVIAIAIPMVWYGFTNARWLDILRTVSLGVPVSTFAYSVPLCMALFGIHSVFHLIDRFRPGRPLDDGSATGELENYS